MKIVLTGRGYVTAGGYGKGRPGDVLDLTSGAPQIPPASEIFETPLARYGRFDAYTKMGCAALALALADAGKVQADSTRPIGIVSSSYSECLETDTLFQETAEAQGGMLASPNLFSYTLPGIVQGECAAHFLLSGPSICVTEYPREDGLPPEPGGMALATAARLFQTGKVEALLVGWVESPLEDSPFPTPSSGMAGGLFAFLEKSGTGPQLHFSTETAGFMEQSGRPVAGLSSLMMLG